MSGEKGELKRKLAHLCYDQTKGGKKKASLTTTNILPNNKIINSRSLKAGGQKKKMDKLYGKINLEVKNGKIKQKKSREY